MVCGPGGAWSASSVRTCGTHDHTQGTGTVQPTLYQGCGSAFIFSDPDLAVFLNADPDLAA